LNSAILFIESGSHLLSTYEVSALTTFHRKKLSACAAVSISIIFNVTMPNE